VPHLQILNAKPIEKAMKKEEGGRGDDENESGDLDIARVWDSKEERKLKKKKRSGPLEEGLDDHHEESTFLENNKVKKSNKFSKNGKNAADAAETVLSYPDEQKESKLKKEKINEFDKASGRKRKELVEAEKRTNSIELDTGEERKHKKQKKSEVLKEKASNVKDKEPAKMSSKKAKQNKASAIDDGETPFSDLFISDLSDPLTSSRKVGNHRTHQQNVDAAAGLATFPKKKKQKKNIVTGAAAVQFSSAIDEIGLGGASTWDV